MAENLRNIHLSMLNEMLVELQLERELRSCWKCSLSNKFDIHFVHFVSSANSRIWADLTVDGKSLINTKK